MIWCRFQAGDRPSYGMVEGDRVTEVTGSPFEDYQETGVTHALNQVKLLAPVVPPMLYAAGPNYRGHVEGMAQRRGADPVYPTQPSPNYRSVTAIIGTEENIIVPKDSSGAVQPEGQLAVVMGKKASKVFKEDALEYVLATPSATI